MRHELSPDQARAIARLRQRHPRCELVVHRRPWGVVVEATRNGQALEMLRVDYYGGCAHEAGLQQAA